MATNYQDKKNGLIELMRFLMSLWVAYFHGFLGVVPEKFNGVNVSVDFFFIISGLFFLKSVEKHRDKPFFKGAFCVVWDRAKRLIVPLIIAALSILTCNIVFPMSFNGFNWPLSFLWFFATQYSLLPLFYLIYKKIKTRAMLNLVCVIIVCISFSLFRLEITMFNPFFRTPGMIALGILISQIPKIKIKLNNEKMSERVSMIINVVGLVLSMSAFIYLASLPGYEIWNLHLSCVVVCPFVAYFMNSIPVRSKLFNFFGELSLYIYLGQCPALLCHYIMGGSIQDQFASMCIFAFALFVINRIINSKKRAKAQ